MAAFYLVETIAPLPATQVLRDTQSLIELIETGDPKKILELGGWSPYVIGE